MLTPEPDRLDSWKQIAAYLGKSERTVRRWQQTEGLPVHRHQHQQKGTVWCYRHEVDAWLADRRESPGDQGEPEVIENQSRSQKPAWIWSAVIAAALVSGLALFAFVSGRPDEPPEMVLNPIPLAQLPGSTYGVDFSPDLTRTIFYWASSTQLSHGIYTKTTVGGDPVALATAEKPGSLAGAYRYSPAWSPDGKTIAYLKRSNESRSSEVVTDLCLTSPTASTPPAPENCPMRLTEGTRLWGDHRHLAWTSDSKWIIAPFNYKDRKGIHAVSQVTGDVRLLSERSSQTQAPTLSPDQKKLVYLRLTGLAGTGPEEMVRQYLTSDMRPDGPSKLLKTSRARTQGMAWDPASKELIVCASVTGYAGEADYRIYRMAAEADAPRRMIHPGNCSTVTVARSTSGNESVLAFATDSRTTKQLLKLSFASTAPPSAFVHSGRVDYMPAHSPDGKHVAFLSNRSGQVEIWVTNPAGTNLRKVTDGAHVVFSPTWSPNSRRLVYASSTPTGRLELSTVSIDGGETTKVPVDAIDAINPFWSEDGAWILYWSGNSFWKIRPDGRDRHEVMRYGPDEYRLRPHYQGGYIYFAKVDSPYSIRRLNMATREEEVLVNSLQSPNFAITGTSLYFIRATVHSRQIYRLSLAKAHDADGAELVSTIPITENVPRVLEGISVAPDDSEVVFSMPSGQTLELQYVRHFR